MVVGLILTRSGFVDNFDLVLRFWNKTTAKCCLPQKRSMLPKTFNIKFHNMLALNCGSLNPCE